MRGILFAGGEAPAPEILREISRGADLLAAADSGLIAAENAGLAPDWVLGDMDSLDDIGRLKRYPPERVLVSPRDKDFTDTELALNLLREKGCGEIWIAGGGGGRIDHLFAIRCLFERDFAPARWYTANEEILLLGEGEARRYSLPGDSVVSLLPVAPWPCEAESTGLKWPLGGLVWERGGFGISNVTPDGVFSVRAIKGRFLIITPLRAGAGQEGLWRRQ